MFLRKKNFSEYFPVLEKLRGKIQIPISVDTSKSEVAEAAAAAGAAILNDVTALRNDPRIAEVARRRKLPLILMRMRGEPRTMQKGPFAKDVLRDVLKGLRHSIALARRAGVAKSQIIVDPGIGFGKNYAQNLELLRRLPELSRLGYPLLVGTSRKSFIAHILRTQSQQASEANDRVRITAATESMTAPGAPPQQSPPASCKAHTSSAFMTSPKWSE